MAHRADHGAEELDAEGHAFRVLEARKRQVVRTWLVTLGLLGLGLGAAAGALWTRPGDAWFVVMVKLLVTVPIGFGGGLWLGWRVARARIAGGMPGWIAHAAQQHGVEAAALTATLAELEAVTAHGLAERLRRKAQLAEDAQDPELEAARQRREERRQGDE